MKIKNSNITINVKDMEKSISFYESIGFTLKQRWSNYYAQLTAPGLVIGLHPSLESNSQRNSAYVSLGFTTEDFEDTRNELKLLGIEVVERKEEGGDFIHFKDPDGTPLYFIHSKR
jgi:catechol 2,3-dioxygenase-like lactoylglutathione lyase family enzyme